MTKTAKKAAKAGAGPKASAKPIAKKSKSSTSSPAKTQKPIAASSSKSGLPAQKMSGEQIEKELAMAHKVLTGAAFLINYMLSTRRLSPKRIADATTRSRDAADYMERLQKVIQSYAQDK